MKNFFSEIKNSYLEHNVLYNLIILSGLCLCSLVTEWCTIPTFLFALLLVFTASEVQGVYYLFFIVAFSGAMHTFGAEVIVPSLIAIYAIATVIKLFIKKKIKINWWLFGLITALVIYMALPMGGYTWHKLLFGGLLLVFILNGICFYGLRKEFDLFTACKFLFAGFIVSVIFSLFARWLPSASQIVECVDFKKLIRFPALFSNTNYFAGFCIMLMAFLITCFMCTNHKKACACMALIVFVIGLFTQSKSYLILSCVVLFVVFVYIIKMALKNNKFRKLVPLGLIVFIVGMSAIIYLLLKRFNGLELNFNSFFTGRNIIWKNVISIICTNAVTFIFGLGMGNIIPTFDGMSTTHNIYLEFFQKLGLVGFLMLLAIIIVGFVLAKRNSDNKISFSRTLPLIVFLLYGLVESMVYTTPLYILIPLSFVLIIEFVPKDKSAK